MDLELAIGLRDIGTDYGAAMQKLRQKATELLQHVPPMHRGAAAVVTPVDRRIETFLAEHFKGITTEPLRLPGAISLHQHGLARELSVPRDGDVYSDDYVQSYRVLNGILNNPRSDRRTTKGTFHITEDGLPIPGDKKAVPRAVFASLFRHAVNPPPSVLTLPFTANDPEPVRTFVTLLLRPIVCPEVPGYCPQKTMEVRFYVPGSLVSNLDFVESIFGNAGDPALPENDAGLDAEHWTGHTGCVILAPHLTQLTKKELGLPSWEAATERQRRDSMCWRDPAEKYNDGGAFKLTCRTAAGVIVTLIADNYYGYCKKEVKTQISYAANLSGNYEEEHAGGAVAYPSYNLGPEYAADEHEANDREFADVVRDYGEAIEVFPEGYGVDRVWSEVVYIPRHARASVARQEIWWDKDGKEVRIPLLPGQYYLTPSGYKIQLEKHPEAQSWRLLGTVPEGLFCHKPCTVSGGGKSEISKSLRDYMLYGPIFVADLTKDFDLVQQIFDRDYSTRWKPGCGPDYRKRPSRPLLSPERSLGSVIKLLTPSDEYTEEFNTWLASFPNYIFPIVFIIKRFLPASELNHWRDFFGVDSINGFPGHELKAMGRKLIGTYLRVGLLSSQGWRTFKVRQDFAAAAKIQTEDDISASVVVPASRIPGFTTHAGLKFTLNCENRLFQRPDDAIHRGLDHQTELDMARPDNFFSNYEPLTAEDAKRLVERVTEFDAFTPPMQQILRSAANNGKGYVVSSAHPRLVDGKPSKNPRYLQTRPDLINPLPKYVAERAARLARGLRPDQPLYQPVQAVLLGRRNNPPEPKEGIRPLAVYGPIHYQEYPELFMDFICSLTGKSPSTTGAGSEGALTKGPFNALRPIVDLNNALVSYLLTGLAGFSTAAGYVGPHMRVDHDISLLIPELWCRLSPRERDPAFLIAEGHLEAVHDFEYAGRRVLASRLGYRITRKFVRTFFGRVFDNPERVFDDAFLRPETQDLGCFVDGVNNITEAQQWVAQQYFEDGSIADACPPLQALLHIMAHGTFEGKDAHHPDIRAMFTPAAVLGSDWYQHRLKTRQSCEARLWQRHFETLEQYLGSLKTESSSLIRELQRRRDLAAKELARIRDPKYLEELVGTLGTDPSLFI